MAWFDSFFSGFDAAPASTGDAMMGGTTDLGPVESGASAWDGLGSVADSVASMGGDWGFGSFGGGVDSANPAMFDPNTLGPPPIGDALPAIPQGSSTVGTFGSGAPQIADVDPETFARQGQTTNSWNPSPQSSVGSYVQPQPGPTAWESVQQAPGKWWQGVQQDFNRAPLGNSMKLGAGLASIGVPLAAALTAPSSPKAPSYSPVPPAPLPGTTGTGRADLPAGSPMSGLLNRSSGGFKIGSNLGIKKKGL